MKYVSGYYAMPLYVNDKSDMSSGIWNPEDGLYDNIKEKLYDTEGNPMGEYGIFPDEEVPGYTESFYVANHIRAYLDMIYYKEFDKLKDLYWEAINDMNMLHIIFEKIFAYKLYEDVEVIKFLSDEFESLFRSYILTVGVDSLVKMIHPTIMED